MWPFSAISEGKILKFPPTTVGDYRAIISHFRVGKSQKCMIIGAFSAILVTLFLFPKWPYFTPTFYLPILLPEK